MTHFHEHLAAAHARLLARIDALAASQGAPAHEPAAPRRLAACHVLLIASGDVGRESFRALASLPLRRLTIAGVAARDPALAELPDAPRCGALQALQQPLDGAASAPLLARHQLVVVATSRPHPALEAAVNRVAVRLRVPLVRVSAFGQEIAIGPVVLAGASACLACLRSRQRSNAPRADVPDALERMLDDNPEFEFRGRLGLVARIAAAQLASEVARLLTGSAVPATLGHLVTTHALTGTVQRHPVAAVAWCPTCDMGAYREPPAFTRMVERHGGTAQRPHAPRVQDELA